MNQRAREILTVDGGAGLLVGVVVLLLNGFVAQLDGFSQELVVALALANLLYGSYSGTLARRAWAGIAPTRREVVVLAVANLTWTCICAGIVVTTWSTATVFGHLHVGLEGLFCAALAVQELRIVLPQAR